MGLDSKSNLRICLRHQSAEAARGAHDIINQQLRQSAKLHLVSKDERDPTKGSLAQAKGSLAQAKKAVKQRLILRVGSLFTQEYSKCDILRMGPCLRAVTLSSGWALILKVHL